MKNICLVDYLVENCHISRMFLDSKPGVKGLKNEMIERFRSNYPKTSEITSISQYLGLVAKFSKRF